MHKVSRILPVLLLSGIIFLTGCIINRAPVITSVTANPSSIYIDETSTLTCNAYDPDGDLITYTWSTGASQATGQSVTYYPDTTGTHTISVRVSDGRLQTTSSVSVDVVYRMYLGVYLYMHTYGADFNLYLYDPDRAEINSSTYTGDDSIEQYLYDTYSTYYLQVYAYSGSGYYDVDFYFNGVLSNYYDSQYLVEDYYDEYLITTSGKGKIINIEKIGTKKIQGKRKKT